MATKNAFTKGLYFVEAHDKDNNEYEVLCSSRRQRIAICDGENNANLMAAARNSATACAALGYDGQKCVELLPEILKAMDDLISASTMYEDANEFGSVSQASKLLRKAKGEA